MDWHIRNGALGNSEGLMVALVLGAVLAHASGRRGWAFALAIGAGMLRPEVWPFLGVYVLWLLYEDRTRLRWIAAGLASLPLLWLGPELWGSGNAFRASDRAQNPNPNSPAFADNPALEVVQNAIGLAPAAAVAGAALAVGLALLALRAGPGLRERLPQRDDALTVLVLAILAAAWIGLVAVMTVRGFSGNSRYLIAPAALLIVIGAAGIVWAVRALVPRATALPAAVLAVAAAGLIALIAIPDADRLEPTLRGIEYQADLYRDLGGLIDEAGGPARLRECGHAFTGPFLVPAVAWHLKVHSNDVDLVPEAPAVIFHVRTTEHAGVVPPPADGRPNELGRNGHWLLTADCAPSS
jgi:hypothetical protein